MEIFLGRALRREGAEVAGVEDERGDVAVGAVAADAEDDEVVIADAGHVVDVAFQPGGGARDEDRAVAGGRPGGAGEAVEAAAGGELAAQPFLVLGEDRQADARAGLQERRQVSCTCASALGRMQKTFCPGAPSSRAPVSRSQEDWVMPEQVLHRPVSR